MEGELSLLSLKWNNHNTAFLHIIGNLRSKSSYADATLACNGKFYPVHRLVMSTCSEYFCDIFEQTNCKNPVIVLKDVECKNLEYLLDYMYIGEVNVKQNELASLVGAAEYLQIKGLAVPDEDLTQRHISSHKRTSDCHGGSSPPVKKKRILKDTLESGNNSDKDRVESSDISKSPEIPKSQKSNFHEPSFIPIKCEPQSDDDIVDDFVSVSEAKTNSKRSRGQIGTKNTNHSEIKKDLVEKEEPFDLSEEDINHPGPSGMYENDQYQPDLSGSIDSDASLSQIPEEAMENTLLQCQDIYSNQSSSNIFDNINALSVPSSNYSSIDPLSLDRIIPDIREENVNGVLTYFCNWCSYSSCNKHHVRRHFIQHTGFKRFHCATCGKKFTNKANLTSHTISFHLGEKPHKCRYCEYRSARKSNLIFHMKKLHVTSRV